jgi:formate dehydrogenase major subunit
MDITRRGFLKATGLGTGIALGFDVARANAEMREFKIARTTETRSTCPYCAVSCGVIIHTLGDKAKNATAAVVHVEGDPDHPINRGTLCPKGSTLRDDINNPNRLLTTRSRESHATSRTPATAVSSRRMPRARSSTGIPAWR